MPTKEELRIRKLVQGATRPEKVVPLVLNAALASEIEDLEKQLIEIRQETEQSLAGNPEAMVIADKIDALVAKAKDSTVDITIRGLPRKEWSDLKAKHPPTDPMMYLFGPKLMDDAVPACWVSPEIDDETRDKLLDELTGGQWDSLCMAVQTVNGDVAVPFSALATVARRPSVASDPPPEPTE